MLIFIAVKMVLEFFEQAAVRKSSSLVLALLGPSRGQQSNAAMIVENSLRLFELGRRRYHLSTSFSLMVVAGLLGTGALASVAAKKKKRKADDDVQVMFDASDFVAAPSALHRRGGGGANGHAYAAGNDLDKVLV